MTIVVTVAIGKEFIGLDGLLARREEAMADAFLLLDSRQVVACVVVVSHSRNHLLIVSVSNRGGHLLVLQVFADLKGF